MADLIEVSDASFVEVLGKAERTVAYFWGIDCPLCAKAQRVIEEAASEAGEDVLFVKVCDVESPETFQSQNVIGVPQVIIYDGQIPVARLTDITLETLRKDIGMV